MTWKIRTEKSGDEAVTLSSVTTTSVGGPRSAPLYGTEDVLAVRVGNLLWFGRAVGVSTGRAHFRSPSLAGLLRGFASVEDQLRKRAH